MFFDFTRKFPNCKKDFYILVIADTHGHITKEQLDTFLIDINNVEAIICLGDIDYRDYQIINSHTKLTNIPKYGILGNHDYFSLLEDVGVQNIHGKIIDINGIKMTGMYGSIKYKNSDAPMFTDEESIKVAETLPDSDIFFTHDKAKEPNNNLCGPHDGMKGITEYILKRKPVYHFHGHLHENTIEKIAGVSSIGIRRYAYIKISKKGTEMIKTY